MRKLKDRLQEMGGPVDPPDSRPAGPDPGMSTREKLERLVNAKLSQRSVRTPVKSPPARTADEPFAIQDYFYSSDIRLGRVTLGGWETVTGETLAVIGNDRTLIDLDPRRMVYVDTETTGLAGGTGTIPFMIGFGFFIPTGFQVRIYILKELDCEESMLTTIEEFLAEHDFAAAVTFNGKCFDFPLLETRYILHRKRFSLLSKPHLDFLFPARTIWKNTYESRRLGFLGEVLLGLSRSDDIEGSQIPLIYFEFLRTRDFSLLVKVAEHNALDILGLSAVLLLAALYIQDHSHTTDSGEILGVAILQERYGRWEQARALYQIVNESASRTDHASQAAQRLGLLLKKSKLYQEAHDIWKALAEVSDQAAIRELSMHYEHRERNYAKALEIVEQALNSWNLSARQQGDLTARLQRLKKKMARLDRETAE
jgi:uncharacterized protein